MATSELRFGVRAVSGRRGATWKAWTDGGSASDFYVSCRALGGEMKASFHQSGQWHVSHTRDFHANQFDSSRPKPPTRFIDKWSRPADLSPGFTLALRVIVPWSAATSPAHNEPETITWVPPAPEGMAVEFAVVLTSPECPVAGWPCKTSMNSQLVGSFPLVSGERVWIIWTVQPFAPPGQPQATGHFLKGKGRHSLLGGNLRSVALAEHTDGSRVLYDIPVELGDA